MKRALLLGLRPIRLRFGSAVKREDSIETELG
jgi:hypothetical protein